MSATDGQWGCDCPRCRQHADPKLRGRQLSAEELLLLWCPDGLPPGPPPSDYGPEVDQAAVEVDAALEEYTDLERSWLLEHQAAQTILESGRRPEGMWDRVIAARGLKDEAGQKLTDARVRHARLTREVDHERRVAAEAEAVAARAAEKAAQQVTRRRSWRDLLTGS